MPVRRVGTWKDAARRLADGLVASVLPGGIRLLPVLAQIDGYLLPHEAVFLYWLARSGPGKGAVVEIGSFRGRSTMCLAAGTKRRGHTRIYSVDPHVYDTERELRENLAHFGFDSDVLVLVAPSLKAVEDWSTPIRLLFIDGSHEESAVEGDLLAWAPCLEPGGFVLLHDSAGPSAFPGPKAVAERHLRSGDYYDALGEVGSTTWARRAGANRPWNPPRWGSKTVGPLIRILQARKASKRRPSN